MDAQTRMKHYILDKILKDTIEDLKESGIGDRDVFLILKEQAGPQSAHTRCGVRVEGGQEVKEGIDGQSG